MHPVVCETGPLCTTMLLHRLHAALLTLALHHVSGQWIAHVLIESEGGAENYGGTVQCTFAKVHILT